MEAARVPRGVVFPQSLPVLRPALAAHHTAHQHVCLISTLSFPFQQTHPALSGINREDVFSSQRL